MRLSNKLLGQGYVKERLKSSRRKFYGRYGDLTRQYEVPLSRMLHDILDDDHIQWHPPLIGHYTNFWPLLIWTLLPNLTFYLIVQGFHRTYATGAACQQRTLTPPDTWSCPTLGLACVLMSRPVSPELVLSPTFEFRTPLGTSLLLLPFLFNKCMFGYVNGYCCKKFYFITNKGNRVHLISFNYISLYMLAIAGYLKQGLCLVVFGEGVYVA